MKKLLILSLSVYLLFACSPTTEQIQKAIEQTQSAELSLLNNSSSTSTDVPLATRTPKPSNTPRPTSTTRPSNTPKPTSTPTELPEQGVAKNYVVSDEDDGILIEVARIVIAPKSAFDQNLFEDEIFDDKSTIVEFTFRLVNNTDSIIRFGYSFLTASVNGEQIDFSDYRRIGEFGDDISDEILPGSFLIGGIRTGIKRSSWDAVKTIVISADGAYNPSTYKSITKDFLFTIDISAWTYEPLPDELK